MAAPHSPVVPPARANASVAGITLSVEAATRRSSASAASTAAWSRAARHAAHVGDHLLADAGIDGEDRALTAERLTMRRR